MNVLAFDTCLGAMSVSVGRDRPDGRYCVTECFEQRSTGHAEAIVPMIRAEMERAGLGFGDLERIAVTLGPGTFTGVRTGIAVARALRLTTGLPVVGATSLAVMARHVHEATDPAAAATPLMIAVDARRGRLYAQVFGASALDTLSEPEELAPEEAANLAMKLGARLAGSGATTIAESAGGKLTVVDGARDVRASDLVRMAAHLAPLEPVTPIYIRPPDAKPQGDKRLKRAS